jgi:hypothetical protein
MDLDLDLDVDLDEPEREPLMTNSSKSVALPTHP